MEPTSTSTGAPSDPPPEGVASPPPFGFTVVILMGAVSIVVWLLSRGFARMRGHDPDERGGGPTGS